LKVNRSRRRALKQIGSGALSAMAQNAVSSSTAQPPLVQSTGFIRGKEAAAIVGKPTCLKTGSQQQTPQQVS
jgi:hypothetical protein